MASCHVSVPLIASSYRSKRSGFLRNFRRRLRTYLLISGLLFILIITIIHKNLLPSSHTTSHRSQTSGDSQIERNDDSRDLSRVTSNNLHSLKTHMKPIKTVIAKYVGSKTWWADGKFNLTDDELNANNYNPIAGEGKNGRPVYLMGVAKDAIDKAFSINKFNLIASDRISVDRKLPDVRKAECHKRKFDLSKLPNTSVIIVFHNEAWSTLLRTVHSILNESPKQLLAEIMLVDDASERTFLKQDLDNYMTSLEQVRGVPIKVLRSTKRIGLIRARLLGVETARGRTLTFIDAHCEATVGWLEPLMDVIGADPTVAAVPIIDTINDQTFAYKRTFDLYIGAFNWGLNFRWYPVSIDEVKSSNNLKFSSSSQQTNQNNTDTTVSVVSTAFAAKKQKGSFIQPFRTPAMAGGLFSIDKQYFEKLGKYDKHMDIWGAENIELSLRIWQCGGQIKAVPCSHVAHLFRKSSPYAGRDKWDVDEIFNFNRVRLIEVWLDEWKQFVYKLNPTLNYAKRKLLSVIEDGKSGIDERLALRTKLQCKSFEWFLQNVWFDNYFPGRQKFFGKFKHKASGKCLERLPSTTLGLRVQKCVDKGIDEIQSFIYDNSSMLVMSNDNNCLDVGSDQRVGRDGFFTSCINHPRQKWNYTTSTKQIVNVVSKLCLEYDQHSNKVQLGNCKQLATSEWLAVEDDWILGKS